MTTLTARTTQLKIMGRVCGRSVWIAPNPYHSGRECVAAHTGTTGCMCPGAGSPVDRQES